jgi:integrase/recombinase XerD
MLDNDPLLKLSRRNWLIDSLLSPVLDAYILHLHSHRYAPSTILIYLGALAHFAFWCKCEHFKVEDIDERLMIQFVKIHLPVCSCPTRCRRGQIDATSALKLLIAVGRRESFIGKITKLPRTKIDIELDEFSDYLLNVRCVASSTCVYMQKHVRSLIHRVSCDENTVPKLKINDVEEFVLDFAQRWQPNSLKEIRASIRNYLSFRAVHGDDTQALIANLPVLAYRGPAKLPQILSDLQLDLFLRSFDQTTPVGQRDFAIARCLVDLGLRGQEAANLSLDSFDWREGIVTVVGGKRRRTHKLPLNLQTGEAIARYIREGRPSSSNRALFVRHTAPYDVPITVSTIRIAMTRAFIRCGLPQFCSTHVLRRTSATRLQNAGVSLKGIADVLGHRSIESVKFYARVDICSLRTIALPWPEKQS